MYIHRKYNNIYIETFGCQMNILDTNIIINLLKKSNYHFVNIPNKANIILYNTCSVRELCEQKVLSRIGYLNKQQKAGADIKIGILGCMAESIKAKMLKNNKSVDFIIGPNQLFNILNVLNNINNVVKNNIVQIFIDNNYKFKTNKLIYAKRYTNLNHFDSLNRYTNYKYRAFVRITRGCNKFCSFCIVPYVRGLEVHRNPKSIIKEIEYLVDKGIKEIVLLGQTINHYVYKSYNKITTLADLLFQIHEQIPTLCRLRFLTSHPVNFDVSIFDVMLSCNRISRYLHIPAQSGSNKILSLMNRGYTIESYYDFINIAKNKISDISIYGDIIVGFPTENEHDFQKTKDLLNNVQYRNIFVFKYSPRPHTVAFNKMTDDVNLIIKKNRNNEILTLQKQISLQYNKTLINKVLLVLVEEEIKHNILNMHEKSVKLKGRSYDDYVIIFYGEKKIIGTIVSIKIISITSLCLYGKLI